MRKEINYFNISVLFISLGIVITTMYVYLPNPHLWYDEAGQFWISQGLNHYSSAFSTKGDLNDLIQNNRDYNMDPGGFSLILYYWQMLSTNWLFLRILPALFFMGFSYCVFRMCIEETGNSIASALTATLFFIMPVFTNRIAEIRAYPMEMLGTLLSILIIKRIKGNESHLLFFSISLLQLFFCTSRYGYIIVSFCISVWLLFILYRNNSFKSFVTKSIVYGLPLVIGVSLIYFGMMKYQNSGALAIEYTPYISRTPRLLLAPLSILLYATLLLLVIKIIKKKPISKLHIAACIIGFTFFVLSCFGAFPWEMHRTISAFLLLILFWIIELEKFIFDKIPRFGVCALFIGVIVYFVVWCTFFNIIHKDETYKKVDNIVYELKTASPSEIITIEYTLNPTIRYEFEYGILKSSQDAYGYPNRMEFIKGPKHNSH